MTKHRRYPGPFGITPPLGMCRWCGLLIRSEDGTLDRTQKFCNSVCHSHFQLRADPARMRQHIFVRDEGVCANCGTKHTELGGEWEADHVIPLMMAFQNPACWEPENLVILCIKPCHVQKSTRDRREFRQWYRRKVQKILDEIR